MKETYTRQEVVKLIEEIMQYPDEVIDHLTNENTFLDVDDLIKLAE